MHSYMSSVHLRDDYEFKAMGESAVPANLKVISLRDMKQVSDSSLMVASRGACGTHHLPAAVLLP